MKHSNEFLLPHTLTSIQHEVVVGSLLGDGSLELGKGKYPRLKITRQIIDRSYLEAQYNVFKELCSSPISEVDRYDSRYGKTHKYCQFKTRNVPAFLKYYHEWYGSGSRQVPENLQLSPLILAIWFADDGCVIENSKRALTVKFSTESFGEYGTNILSTKLEERYNVKFPFYHKKKEKNQFIIKVSTIAANPLLKEIEPYIIQMGMTRKSDIWKDHNLDEAPTLGRQRRKEPELDLLMKELPDFSIGDLLLLSSQTRERINYYIGYNFEQQYLTRQKVKGVFRYCITSLGSQKI
jgi:LAGLIDADG DNA endonuclease family protein